MMWNRATIGRLIVLPILVLALGSPLGAAADAERVPVIPDATADGIFARAAETLGATPLPGMSIGLVAGDRLERERGFGFADRDSRKPATSRTLYQIGSITKSFTATLLGILADEKVLALDDRIAQHLPPDLRLPRTPPDRPITLRLLASHRSGLPGRPPALPASVDEGLVRSFSHFQLYQSIERATLDRPPGSAFGYSNLGYGVLGHILKRATGTPYEELLEQRIFRPLGMDWSVISYAPRHVEWLATPYRLDEDSAQFVKTLPQQLGALAPAGGIWSSVEDLAHFIALHLGRIPADRVPITSERLKELHTTQRISLKSPMGYGLGWGSDELEAGPIVFHDGGCDGYTAYIGFSPARSVGVIILTNVGSKTAARPVRELGHWALGRLMQSSGE